MNQPAPKRRISPLATTVAAGATVLAAIAAALGISTQTADTPTLATAVGPNMDVNIVRWSDDKVEVRAAEFDDAGHAKQPQWRAGGVTGRVPFSPVMNWNFGPSRAVASREIALRYCMAELTAPGQPVTIPAVVRGVLDEFHRTFDLLPFVEGCTAPHMVLGPTAGRDCGIGDQAWGCAWLTGPNIRITHNGTVFGRGQMTLAGLAETYRHEIGHYFDRDHTDCGHPHATNMAPVGCGSAGIAVQDYDDGHLGIRLRAVNPPPPPPPPPPQTQVKLQRWIEASREPCAQPSGAFCIQTGSEVGPPTDARPWYTIVIDRGGQYEYPLPFIEVGP